MNFCFPIKTKVRWKNPFYYSSHIIHCFNQLITARRKYSENPIQNDLDSFQSLQRDSEDSAELYKIIYINGSSTSSLDQCFSLLKSLKNLSLSKQMFLSHEKLLNSEIPTAFKKCFSGNFRIDSYDGLISAYGALELDSVLGFVSSSSITFEIMRTKESLLSKNDTCKSCSSVWNNSISFILLYNLVFCFPSIWKVARITNVFKSY